MSTPTPPPQPPAWICVVQDVSNGHDIYYTVEVTGELRLQIPKNSKFPPEYIVHCGPLKGPHTSGEKHG